MGKKSRILFVAPHADDIESFCCSTCQSAVNAGYDVHEVLACADEYGTNLIPFRGKRIALIRKKEMNNAAKVYGQTSDGKPRIVLHWMPYIDGNVPFSRESVAKYRELIQSLDPLMIFGPDPFFPIDTHPDHLNTGRNFYFALRSLPENRRPRFMFYYQSYHPNFYLPYQSIQVMYKARMAHRSQFDPIQMKLFTWFGLLFKRSIAHGGRLLDNFRVVNFSLAGNSIDSFPCSFYQHLKRGLWEYTLKFGAPIGIDYSNPSVDQILEEYQKSGWA